MDPRDQLLQNMKGTKANATSNSSLACIFLVEENITTRGGVSTEHGCSENSPHTGEEDLRVSQLLLAILAGIGAGEDDNFFVVVSSPVGFKHIHVPALQWSLLVKTHCPLPCFWLILIAVLHSYGCDSWPSAACRYSSWFLLWCWGSRLWILLLDWKQLSLPLLLPKPDPGIRLERWNM